VWNVEDALRQRSRQAREGSAGMLPALSGMLPDSFGAGDFRETRNVYRVGKEGRRQHAGWSEQNALRSPEK